MKKSLLTITLIFAVMVSIFAQVNPYHKVMITEISKLDQADSLKKFQQSANAFSRISQLNPKEWQPYYYGALAYIYQGLDGSLSLAKKDEALAKAAELIKKADAISPDNSEIITSEWVCDNPDISKSLVDMIIDVLRKEKFLEAHYN